MDIERAAEAGSCFVSERSFAVSYQAAPKFYEILCLSEVE